MLIDRQMLFNDVWERCSISIDYLQLGRLQSPRQISRKHETFDRCVT